MVKRRIIPAFLVLCVIFAIVPRPGAAAAGMSGLEVTGQTPMTQQTFTDLSVIGADSCGLTDAINGSKNPAQTIGEWIKGYWDSWLLRQQLTWGTVLNIAAAGARYTGNGDLLFNSQLSDLFTRFYNWLWDGEDGPKISENAETIPGSDVGSVDMSNVDRSVLNYPQYDYQIQFANSISYLDSKNVSHVYSIEDGYIFWTNQGGSYYRPTYISETYNASVYWDGEVAGAALQSARFGDDIYYYYNIAASYITPGKQSGAITNVYNNGNLINIQNWSGAMFGDIGYLIFSYGQSIGDDQILGDPDKLGGLTGSERKRVAPPDIINFPDFGGNSGTIDVNDYLGGLRGAIESQDGTADVNITNSEGVESTETMTIDQTSDIPAETESTSDIVNQGELISTATPSTDLADYTIDLRNYFPFCIPWDLYDMITILVAEPVAPHVQYPFVIEPLNVNYTIDLDFSQFDSVAAVLRTMELLASGIGLALMTKRLIQGGD